MKIFRAAALAVSIIASLLLPELALAQTSPNFQYGQVLTAAQWNAAFAAKQDAFGPSFTYSGTFNVSGQLLGAGTQTNDNAAAGYIGEFMSSNVPVGSAVALTTATAADITTLSLTAGDWDVSGTVCFAPAASTSVTLFQGWISQSSTTVPTDPNTGADVVQNSAATVLGAVHQCMPVGVTRESLSATHSVYLSVQSTFTVSTEGAFGFLRARRVR